MASRRQTGRRYAACKSGRHGLAAAAAASPLARNRPISGSSLAPIARSRRKRLFDIAAAAVALLAFLPLLGLIGTAIWMESDGPIFFRQRRTGLNGQPFRIYKFRTMYVLQDGSAVPQASRGDARITPLGSVLRRLSIDELPQLLNVLKGDMSIVGPRPHALAHDQLWSAAIPNYAGRFRARPGLTGRAQVQGYRGEITSPDALRARIAADNAYIENWTFVGDLALVLRTVPVLFGDEDAF
jgi:putative colanic acid biosysnthesis UDP-glucose lipid carrier transferase